MASDVSGHPGFVQPLARVCQDNRAAVQVLVQVCNVFGYALTGSIFLASLGLPMLATGALLTLLLSDGSAAGAVREAARSAVTGIDIALLLIAFTSTGAFLAIVATLGATLAALPMLGTIAVILGALRACLSPLTAGGTPSGAVLGAFAGVVGNAAGVDVGPVSRLIGLTVDEAEKNPAVRSQLKSKGSAMATPKTRIQIAKSYLLNIVRDPGRSGAVANTDEVFAAKKLAVDGADFRPLVMLAIALRQQALGKDMARASVTNPALYREIAEAAEYLKALKNSPSGPWNKIQAVAFINDPRSARLPSGPGSGGGASPGPAAGGLGVLGALGVGAYFLLK